MKPSEDFPRPWEVFPKLREVSPKPWKDFIRPREVFPGPLEVFPKLREDFPCPWGVYIKPRKVFLKLRGVGNRHCLFPFEIQEVRVAETASAILDHTISGGAVRAVRINGIELPELGINGALAGLKRDKVPVFKLNPPLNFELELLNSSQAEMPSQLPQVKRTAPRTVAFSANDYLEGFKILRVLIALASV